MSKKKFSQEIREIANAIYTQNALRSRQLSDLANDVERLEKSIPSAEARELAEEWERRADDAGRLARAILQKA